MFFPHSYLCAWTVYLVSTLDPCFLVAGRWMRGGRTDWSGYSAVGMICRHLMHCNVELCPDQCLVSVRFLHRAIVDGYFILRIFPVSASSISLCCTCILLCGCVGVSVRHYCCGFRSMSLKLGYRTLNCIVHFFGPLFWFLFFFAWGLLKIFSKSFCRSYCFVCSFLFGIRLCRLVF